nr:insulin-2 precursor [Pampus argenteus]
MATLWLHSASLLILLVMSCPGSKAVSSQHLCGHILVDALYLVCAERGFFYPTEDTDSVLRSLPPKAGRAAPTDDDKEVTNFLQNSKNQMEMMVKRGIVEQCCHRPCSIFELENYCN